VMGDQKYIIIRPCFENVKPLILSAFAVASSTHYFEELDGRAVSALSVRSRKLSTGLNGQS
jgi:hypothetical protein